LATFTCVYVNIRGFLCLAGASHRARIPALIMSRVNLTTPDFERRSTRKFTLNAQDGRAYILNYDPVCLSVFICLSVYVFIFTPAFVSTCLFVSVCVCLSVCISVCASAYYPWI